MLDNDRLDEIGEQFERAWANWVERPEPRGERPRIEPFLGSIPQDERPLVLKHLLLIELGRRRKLSERPLTEEYANRFPDDRAVVLSCFAQGQPQGPGDRFVREGGAMSNEAASPADFGNEENKRQLDFLLPATNANEIGRIGAYAILRVIGRGAMGVVVAAEDTIMQRKVALKFLTRELAGDRSAWRRVLDEARALASIREQANIIHVYSVGVARDGEVQGFNPDEMGAEGRPVIVMELVKGESLQQLLDREGKLPVEQVIGIGKQIAMGLAAAHQSGRVHQDIKPANILIEDNGEPHVKITDFGLARAAERARTSLTWTIEGTPAYMAPEQLYPNKEHNHRADLFSLGAVLYAMCTTGRSPFEVEKNLGKTMERVRDYSPPSIKDVPDWLSEMIDKLLAKDPAKRFQQASEVVERYEARLRKPAAPPPPAPPPPAPPAPVPPRRSFRVVASAVCLSAILLVALVLGIKALWPAPEGPNVVLTKEAWAAYEKGQALRKANKHDSAKASFTTAKERAETCIEEYLGQAKRRQAELVKGEAKLPLDSVSAEDKKRILENGLLNDVATCLWIKGRAAQYLGLMGEARQAYEQAKQLTYARCLSTDGKTFWSPALRAEDDLTNLGASSRK